MVLEFLKAEMIRRQLKLTSESSTQSSPGLLAFTKTCALSTHRSDRVPGLGSSHGTRDIQRFFKHLSQTQVLCVLGICTREQVHVGSCAYWCASAHHCRLGLR